MLLECRCSPDVNVDWSNVDSSYWAAESLPTEHSSAPHFLWQHHTDLSKLSPHLCGWRPPLVGRMHLEILLQCYRNGPLGGAGIKPSLVHKLGPWDAVGSKPASWGNGLPASCYLSYIFCIWYRCVIECLSACSWKFPATGFRHYQSCCLQISYHQLIADHFIWAGDFYPAILLYYRWVHLNYVPPRL